LDERRMDERRVDERRLDEKKMVEQEARSGCPINAAVEAFGDSWSLLVLRDVMFGNRRYFRELLAGSEERIASNILADRLKRLVRAGLLTREEAGHGRRAAYSLTEESIQLVPVFAQLGEWGLRHRPTTRRLRVRAEVLAEGGPPLWAELMAELRVIHLGAPVPERTSPSAIERLAEAYAAAS
jgi:DNA-binding HxlR family transcriptional regulator